MSTVVTDDFPNARLQQLVVVPATTRLGRFLEGAATPWVGLKVLRLRPRLWAYAVVPVLLNLVITVVALAAMVVMAVAAIAVLNWWLGDWSGYWFFAKIAVLILGGAAMAIVCIAAAVITWRVLSGVLCGYFYGRLAARVEVEFGMNPDHMRSITLTHELLDTANDLMWLLISLALALLVSLIPFIGPPIALAYSLYFQFLTCGRDQLSYPLALRGLRRSERLAFSREHPTHVLGLGAVVLLLEFIPVVGALLMVTAAAGAVVLHRRLLEAASDNTESIDGSRESIASAPAPLGEER